MKNLKKRISNSYSLPQAGISRFAVIGGLGGGMVIILIIIAVFVAGNSTSDSKNSSTAKQPGSQASANTTSSGTSSTPIQPAFIRIPESYDVYSNASYKYSFAYPQPWGTIQPSTSTTDPFFTVRSLLFTNYALGDSLLNGQIEVAAVPLDKLSLLSHNGGASITAVKLGSTYGWKVVAAGSADTNYKVGDNYPVKVSTYQANIPIYDLSINESNHQQTRWAIISGDNVIVLSMPILSRADGAAPASNDAKQYAAISNNIARTLRPTIN